MNIRPFEVADEAGASALWEAVFAEDPPWNKPIEIIRTKRGVQPHLFFVAVLDEQVVGTVIAGFDGVRGWIHKLATSPTSRAKALVGC